MIAIPLGEAAVLGLVQGTTEFLPVSSAGHLALAQLLYGGDPETAVTAVLHGGTFVATLVFLRKRVWNAIEEGLRGLGRPALLAETPGGRDASFVAVATVPTIAVAATLKHEVGSAQRVALSHRRLLPRERARRRPRQARAGGEQVDRALDGSAAGRRRAGDGGAAGDLAAGGHDRVALVARGGGGAGVRAVPAGVAAGDRGGDRDSSRVTRSAATSHRRRWRWRRGSRS